MSVPANSAMWRDLLTDVKQSCAPGMSFEARSEVHQAFLHALQQQTPGSIQGLPERLVVFGITALPMQTMQALVALGYSDKEAALSLNAW